MPDYGSSSYWDERYAADDRSYDWYQDYAALAPHINPILKKALMTNDFEILVPGCGSSKLGAEIYDRGCKNITNIDTSTVVISQMTELYAEREEMEFTVMDARRMEYIPDQCFDLIIDKALLDTLICSENNLSDVGQYVQEMMRVLKVGGVFIVISHGMPDSRLPYLQKSGNVEIEIIQIAKPELREVEEEGDMKYHYLYKCQKSQN
eukprot:gene10537-14157_t